MLRNRQKPLLLLISFHFQAAVQFFQEGFPFFFLRHIPDPRYGFAAGVVNVKLLAVAFISLVLEKSGFLLQLNLPAAFLWQRLVTGSSDMYIAVLKRTRKV